MNPEQTTLLEYQRGWTDTQTEKVKRLKHQRVVLELEKLFKSKTNDEVKHSLPEPPVDLDQYQVEELRPNVCEFAGCGSNDVMGEEIFGQILVLCRGCGSDIHRILVNGYESFRYWAQCAGIPNVNLRWPEGVVQPW